MGHVNAFKGTKLRAIRKKELLSAKYIGIKVLGFVSGHNVNKYENGRIRPPEDVEQKLCEFFKVDKNYFRT